MARVTLILSNTMPEGYAYAKVVGFKAGGFRVVRKAGSIRGVRNADVHLLSSFHKRLDRHAIMSALRLARTLDVYTVDFDLKTKTIIDPSAPPEVERTEVSPGAMIEDAYRMNAAYDDALEAAAQDQAVNDRQGLPSGPLPFAPPIPSKPLTLESVMADLTEQGRALGRQLKAEREQRETEIPDEAPRARRTRCKTCKALYLASDPTEAAAHEHKAPTLKSVAPLAGTEQTYTF